MEASVIKVSRLMSTQHFKSEHSDLKFNSFPLWA